MCLLTWVLVASSSSIPWLACRRKGWSLLYLLRHLLLLFLLHPPLRLLLLRLQARYRRVLPTSKMEGLRLASSTLHPETYLSLHPETYLILIPRLASSTMSTHSTRGLFLCLSSLLLLLLQLEIQDMYLPLLLLRLLYSSSSLDIDVSPFFSAGSKQSGRRFSQTLGKRRGSHLSNRGTFLFTLFC